MDFSSLDVFRAVAAAGSVTRAAAALDRAPSNVTTRIRSLEDDLGAALFLRDGKRMTLTAEGETFLGFALRLLALEAEARSAVRPGVPAGRLRLGAMESTAASRLPAPLARYHAAYPDVALELVTGTSRDLAARVREHDLDCALIAALPGEEGATDLDPALEAAPVFVEDLLLVAPLGHGAITGPDDVAPDTLAALPAGCTYRALAEAWLQGERAGRRPLRRMELASYDAMLACVAAGVAVAAVPASVLDLRPGLAGLVTAPIARLPTLLIRRKGYRSAAFETLKAMLAPSHQQA